MPASHACYASQQRMCCCRLLRQPALLLVQALVPLTDDRLGLAQLVPAAVYLPYVYQVVHLGDGMSASPWHRCNMHCHDRHVALYYQRPELLLMCLPQAMPCTLCQVYAQCFRHAGRHCKDIRICCWTSGTPTVYCPTHRQETVTRV